jgi:hypothetical protein
VRDIEAFRAFLDEDCSDASQATDHFWRLYKRTRGVAAAFRLVDEVRQQYLAAHPDWPSAEEREEDMATHLRVIDVIRRIQVPTR